MYQSPVAVSKSLTPKPAPADITSVAKSLPSGQSIQLEANLEQRTSIVDFDQNLGKSIPSSPFQFKFINGIPTNNHPIQRKSASTWAFQLKPVTVNSSAALPIQKASAPTNKTGLPDQLKSGVESLSGMAMDDVKVHYNSDKPAQLQAHAYAQGTDIHVAAGQEKHLPHEAWHVVQQKQGRVQATTQLKGTVPVNDDAGLEREADRMGAKAVQMKMVDSSPLNISKSENAIKHNTPAQLVKGTKKVTNPEGFDESDVYDSKNQQNSQMSNPMKGLSEDKKAALDAYLAKEPRNAITEQDLDDEEFNDRLPEMETRNAITEQDLDKDEIKGLLNEIQADADPEGLFSAFEGKRHDMHTKASKILTGKIDVNEFYKAKPAYGILGVGKGPNPDLPSGKIKDDESDKSIGRLSRSFIQQPGERDKALKKKNPTAPMKLGYHLTISEGGAKSVATRVDPKFHNEESRFGGGFHIAADIPTGAMEVDHHRNDWKKGDAKKAKDEGKSLEEQKAAYDQADEINPTNFLTYQVNLSGGDILDATGPLTAMAMNRPKEIERAAREDNMDGILYKSSRGPGLALVLYKNYTSVLTLLNKEVAQTKPDKFTEEHVMDRELTRNAIPASEKDTLKDRNPTTKISNKLPPAL